ncbi:histidine kinase [Dactylosporangium sp. NPDC049742]|uniref:sensor histidine kinase n=1 Tax=Dactylosporangium sp. NPDC049742 TaxID=3154737 RepID=UPI0034299BFF
MSASTAPITWHAYHSLSASLYNLLAIATLGFLCAVMAWLFGLATQMPATEARLAAIEVARERRRLLRDAHDVLGFRLSAIVLKLELARRGDPGQARREVTEAGAQASAALAEIHTLTRQPHDLKLADELAAVGPVLMAAGVRLDAPGAVPPLPPPADAVLATVLREAVTNVLRHSTARHCEITVAGGWRTVRLTVANDGRAAGPVAASAGGTGLAGLAERLAAFGGRLDVAADGDRHRLTATLPVHRFTGRTPATPFRPAVCAAALAVLFALAFTQAPPASIDGVFLLLAALFGVSLWHLCRPRTGPGTPRRWRAVLAAHLLLAYAPLLLYPPGDWVMRHYVGAAVLLLVRGRTWVVLAAAILTTEVLLAFDGGLDFAALAYHVTADIDDATAVFALAQVPLLAAALARAQAMLAAAEVARERLRFADQVGHRLTERLRGVVKLLAAAADTLPGATSAEPIGAVSDERAAKASVEPPAMSAERDGATAAGPVGAVSGERATKASVEPSATAAEAVGVVDRGRLGTALALAREAAAELRAVAAAGVRA